MWAETLGQSTLVGFPTYRPASTLAPHQSLLWKAFWDLTLHPGHDARPAVDQMWRLDETPLELAGGEQRVRPFISIASEDGGLIRDFFTTLLA